MAGILCLGVKLSRRKEKRDWEEVAASHGSGISVPWGET